MQDEHNNPGTASDRLSAINLAPHADNIVGTAATIATIVANLDAAEDAEQRHYLERFAEEVREHAGQYHDLARTIEDHLRRTPP